jgi:alkylation response protein AidB-like acyl-CoA dehydrogenase
MPPTTWCGLDRQAGAVGSNAGQHYRRSFAAVHDQAVCRPWSVGHVRPTATNVHLVCPARATASEYRARSSNALSKITQIYEGTNQIQRMVMARALLRN